MTNSDIKDEKQRIRAQLKQIRATLPEKSRQAASKSITNTILSMEYVRKAKSVFCFISYGNEVHTHDLLKYFLKEGKHLAVPRILPEKTMIAVPFTDWNELQSGEMGILTPVSNQPDDGRFDVVITPGLGFTSGGYRIGYGRGYYDKWFESHMTGRKIAICYEAQLVDELPVEETDVPVDVIVTEKRTIIIHNG